MDERTGELIVKFVNVSSGEISLNMDIEGTSLSSFGSLTVLKNSDLGAENSFDVQNIKPEVEEISIDGSTISVAAPAYSMSVLRVKESQSVN